MLKQEVMDAVKEDKFHIWAISTIEEGIEILTGMEAGTVRSDGTYPDGTAFRRVDERLVEFGEIVRKFGGEREEELRETHGRERSNGLDS
jgi:predicted ATP-dependent protease